MKTIKILILGLLSVAFLFATAITVNATITYNAGTNLITLDDSAGAGDSWGTAYDMEDVLAQDVAGGWGVVTKQGANAYDISARMQFNAGVYFVSTSEFVEVKPNPINPAWTWRAQAGSHIRIGEWDSTDEFSYNGAFWRVYVASTTLAAGNYFKGETLIYGSNFYNDALNYQKAISCEPSGTTKIYNSIIQGISYMRTTDIDMQDVKWMYNAGASHGLMVASGYDYAWSGITTMDASAGAGGFFMSGTTTSAVDMYGVTFLGCARDVTLSGGCNWLLRLINSPTFSTISVPGSGKPGAKICYTFNVKVTDGTNPIIGATVELKDVNGTIVFSEQTVSGGVLTADKIVTKDWYRHTDDGGNKNYNPHTLKVTSGADVTEYQITIDHQISEDIVLVPQSTASYDNIMAGINEIKGSSFAGANDSLYNISNAIDNIDGNPALTIQATTGAFYSLSTDMAIFIIAQDADNNLTSATITVSIYNETGTQVSTGNAVAISTGRYKYTFSIPADATLRTYRVDVNATDGTNTAYDTTSFVTSENLPFIIEDDGTIIIKKSGFSMMGLLSIPSVLYYFYRRKKKKGDKEC